MCLRTLAATVALLGIAAGQSSPLSLEEGQKANYLCNFARFVEWPSRAFSGPDSPIEICILGKTSLEFELVRAIQGKMADNHPLELELPKNVSEARGCHVVFISRSEKAQAQQIVRALADQSVLTVSDMEGFRSAGGMINFVMEGAQLRFEVDLGPTQHAGLKMSSRLLATARMVISPQGESR